MEIVAILSSGVSYNRLLRPYMISATVIAILSLLLNNFVIPHATKNQIAFEDIYIKNQFYNRDKNIHFQISPNNYIYLERYSTDDNTGYKFSIEKFKDGKLYYKLISENIKEPYIFMFIYTAKDELKYTDLEEIFKKVFVKFLSKIEEDGQN